MHLVFFVGFANSDVFPCGNGLFADLLAHLLDFYVIICGNANDGDAETRYVDWGKGVFEDYRRGGDCYDFFEDATDRERDD
jgi:hypothetical protein